MAQGQSWAWVFPLDPFQHRQREGEVKAGSGGGVFLSGGRMCDQCRGDAAAGCLDEVGAGDGAKHHLEGHLEVEPSEDRF